jgi:uncharacterized glyoxalase superfamily protein PhnB
MSLWCLLSVGPVCENPSMGDRSFPIVSVERLPAVVEFYERMGFVRTYAFPPEGEPAFVTVERDGSTLGISARTDTAGDRFGYWIYVDDVDATFESLVDAGAPVVAHPATEGWGERVATVRDPDGNLVHLGAPTPD